jgi:hypothetical protein
MNSFKQARMSILLYLLMVAACPSTGFLRLDNFYKRLSRRYDRHTKRIERKKEKVLQIIMPYDIMSSNTI